MPMTTKDLCYLGTLTVLVLLAYCHGFFSGFGRARNLYESLLGRPNVGRGDVPANEPGPMKLPGSASGQLPGRCPPRNRLSGQDLQGDFGNN